MNAVMKTLAALAATAALLAAAGCGDDEAAPSPADREVGLQAARPGEVAAYAKDRLRERERARAAGTGGDTTVPTVMPAPSTGVAAPPRSSAPMQEAGVDEAELLKTDGGHFYAWLTDESAAGASTLKVWRREADASATALASLPLPAAGGTLALQPDGLLLTDDGRTLAAVAQRWQQRPGPEVCPECATLAVIWMQAEVTVRRLDVSAPATPQAGTELVIDGQLVGSRRLGDRLVLVTNHVPTLPPDVLPADADAAAREAAIAGITAAHVLPRVRVNGGAPEPLVAEGDCWLQTGNGSTVVQTTAITVIDLASPALARQSRCFVGGAEAMYLSTDALVLASTRWTYWGNGSLVPYPPDFRTDLHRFVLDGSAAQYRGSGSVAGHLGWNTEQKPLRLSEHAGHLRVLTFTGSFGIADTGARAAESPPPASPATLTVLRENTATGALDTLSVLPNSRRPQAIGREGEQVRGVRFDGTRAYVVTFRTTDPLYVLDLANPADPRVAGELQVPGFSDHLVPLPGGLLLGAGRDADDTGRVTGLRFSLFDVQNPAAPTERGHVLAGGRYSGMALDSDRHALDIGVFGPQARVATPVLLSDDGSAWTDGLQRLQVDLAARTLTALPMAGERRGSAPPIDWQQTRSVQVGDHLYLLRDGALTAQRW